MTAAGPPIVIGVGEEFLHDDGVGPAVIAELRRLAARGALPPDTRLESCFGEPAGLINLWHGSRLAIVVDAAAADARAGFSPGDVVRWEVGEQELEGRPSPNAPSTPNAPNSPNLPNLPLVSPGPAATHGLGPGAAIALARILDRLPARLVLFAVVGGDFALGPGLSEPVAAAVRRVALDIAAEVGAQVRREGLSARCGGDLGSWSGGDERPRLEA